MGLFGGPVMCSICGRDISLVQGRKQRVKDGVLCNDCWVCAGGLKGGINTQQITVEQLRGPAEIGLAKLDSRQKLSVDLAFGGTGLDQFFVSTKENKWYYGAVLCDETGAIVWETHLDIYSYDDVEKIWVKSESISTTTSTQTKNNGVGRAIVGGVLAGSTGAIVGAVTANPQVSQQTRTEEIYRVYMVLKPYPGRTWQFVLDSAQDVNTLLELFGKQQPAPAEPLAPVADPATEIRKFKALLDDGIITQEEFDAKKKQLLGL